MTSRGFFNLDLRATAKTGVHETSYPPLRLVHHPAAGEIFYRGNTDMMGNLEKQLQFEFEAWAKLYLFAFEHGLPGLADWAARKLWATHLVAVAHGFDMVIPDA